MVNSIKGYNRWALTFEKFCKPMHYSKIRKYEHERLLKKGESQDIIDAFDTNSQMMI